MKTNHLKKITYSVLFCLCCGIGLFLTGCIEVQKKESVVQNPAILEEARQCIECHKKNRISNIALRDWQNSTHAEKNVTCVDCHFPVENASKEILEGSTLCDNKAVRRSVSPKNCEFCHAEQAEQFSSGKHANAWKVLEELQKVEGMSEIFDIEKDCSGCHRIGKAEGKCDSCHTRHKFAASEARKPEACRTCHMGANHPQWETYSASKHGSIYSMEGQDWYWEKSVSEWYKDNLLESPVIPRAPVCVTCHMAEGNHSVNTGWGSMGMRLSEKDPEWEKNRDLFFNGLGFFNEEGYIADELVAIVEGREGQLSKNFWVEQRGKMIKVCSQCHTASFSKDVMTKADNTIKDCDKLLVKAINVVNGLYKDGIIEKSKRFFPHIDIIRFDKFKNPIEERLYKMFVDHRMKTYLGAFHFNPGYQHGSGWAEMKHDLGEIETMANNLRK